MDKKMQNDMGTAIRVGLGVANTELFFPFRT